MKRMWRQSVRWVGGPAAVAVVLLGASAPAQAQISRVSSSASDLHQAFGVTAGVFAPKGESGRVAGDVLNVDLDTLAFNIGDFKGGTFSGEYLAGFGNYLEAGISAGFYQRSVPSVDRSLVNANGSEIAQDLKLRVVPLTATVRFLPAGRGSVEPYVGAGIGAFRWHYSEIGQFVDDRDRSIFNDRYLADGTAYGPVVLGGVRFPFGEMMDFGGEVRYQRAEGDTKPAQSRLLGDKIDLGGWNAAVTLHFRF